VTAGWPSLVPKREHNPGGENPPGHPTCGHRDAGGLGGEPPPDRNPQKRPKAGKAAGEPSRLRPAELRATPRWTGGGGATAAKLDANRRDRPNATAGGLGWANQAASSTHLEGRTTPAGGGQPSGPLEIRPRRSGQKSVAAPAARQNGPQRYGGTERAKRRVGQHQSLRTVAFAVANDSASGQRGKAQAANLPPRSTVPGSLPRT